MKMIITVFCLSLSLSAFSSEFQVDVLNSNCHIKDGQVSRTQSFGKKSEISFTEYKKVDLKGVDSFVDKAMTFASGFPRSNSGMSYAVIVNGKKNYIEAMDSLESELLIRMLNKICR